MSNRSTRIRWEGIPALFSIIANPFTYDAQGVATTTVVVNADSDATFTLSAPGSTSIVGNTITYPAVLQTTPRVITATNDFLSTNIVQTPELEQTSIEQWQITIDTDPIIIQNGAPEDSVFARVTLTPPNGFDTEDSPGALGTITSANGVNYDFVPLGTAFAGGVETLILQANQTIDETLGNGVIVVDFAYFDGFFNVVDISTETFNIRVHGALAQTFDVTDTGASFSVNNSGIVSWTAPTTGTLIGTPTYSNNQSIGQVTSEMNRVQMFSVTVPNDPALWINYGQTVDLMLNFLQQPPAALVWDITDALVTNNNLAVNRNTGVVSGMPSVSGGDLISFDWIGDVNGEYPLVTTSTNRTVRVTVGAPDDQGFFNPDAEDTTDLLIPQSASILSNFTVVDLTTQCDGNINVNGETNAQVAVMLSSVVATGTYTVTGQNPSGANSGAGRDVIVSFSWTGNVPDDGTYLDGGEETTLPGTVTCQQDAVALPVVLTNQAFNVMFSSAQLSGNVSGLATDTWFLYSTSQATVDAGGGTRLDVAPPDNTGVFNEDLTGLDDDTTYYYRAYASNAVGTSNGATVSFETEPAIVVTVPTVGGTTIIELTSGIRTHRFAAAVTDEGNEAPTSVGFEYSASSAFTGITTLNATYDTVTDTFEVEAGIPDGDWFIRAFATNSAGTGRGQANSFTQSGGMGPGM